MVISDFPTAIRFALPHFSDLEVEELWALALDQKCVLLRFEMIYRGTNRYCPSSPREIFRFALNYNASFLILFHNHPSGDPSPSAQDRKITKKIVQLGHMLELPILDHIVIGKNDCYSLLRTSMMRIPRMVPAPSKEEGSQT